MGRKRLGDTKNIILKASQRLFSDKGYDGTRVDDIAEEAGVNKALIYYYFKSKEEILKTIFDTFVEDTIKVMKQSFNKYINSNTEFDYDFLFKLYLDFVQDRKDVIKIVFIESLKSNQDIPIFLKISQILMNNEIDILREVFEKKGWNLPKDKQLLLVTEFFTGILPICNFVMFKDIWTSYYNISEEQLTQNFIKAFSLTHLNYHINN